MIKAIGIAFLCLIFLRVDTFLYAKGVLCFEDPLGVECSSNLSSNTAFFFKDKQCLSLKPCSHLSFLNQKIALFHSKKNAKEMTLYDVIDLALKHHPQVQILREMIHVQSAQLGQARALYLPNLNVGASYTYQKTLYPESLFDVHSEVSKATYYLSLTWKLLDFGARRAQNRRADALLEASIAHHDALIYDILLGIVERYFDAQTKKATADVRKENVELAKQILNIIQMKESVGVADPAFLLQAKTSLAKSELDYTRTKGQYDKSLMLLTFALGLENGPILLSSEPELNCSAELLQHLSEWLAFAKAHHPSLRAAKAKLKAEKEYRSLLISEALPVLEFSQGEYRNGRPNQGLSSTQSQESMSSFSLSMPVFEGFSRRYKLKESDAQIKIKEAELRAVELKIVETITLIYYDALLSLQTLNSVRHLLEVARSSLENVKNKYEKGVSDRVEVLNAQAAFFDANLDYTRTLSEWHSSFLRLVSYSGVLKTL